MKYLEEIGLPKHGLRLPMRLSKDLDFAALQSGRCWARNCLTGERSARQLCRVGQSSRALRKMAQLHMSGAAEPRMRSDMACHDRRESCRVRRSTVSPPSDVKIRTEQ
jgi:hypothetical protein